MTVYLGGDDRNKITVTAPSIEYNAQSNRLLSSNVEKAWLYMSCKRPKGGIMMKQLFPFLGVMMTSSLQKGTSKKNIKC